MADSELTVTAKFDDGDIEVHEVDRVITEAIEELEIARGVTIKLTYSLKYHGVVQK